MKIYPDNKFYYPKDSMIIQKSTKNLIIHVNIDETGNTFKVPLKDIIEFLDSKRKE